MRFETHGLLLAGLPLALAAGLMGCEATEEEPDDAGPSVDAGSTADADHGRGDDDAGGGTVDAGGDPTPGLAYDAENHEFTLTGHTFGPGPHVVVFENFEHGSRFSDHFASISEEWFDDVIFYEESDGNHAYRLKDPEADGKGFTQASIQLGGSYAQAYVALSAKTPDGTTFAAAAAEETFPDASSWKFTWLYSGDEGYGGDGIFDMCLPTHIGNGQNVLGGNEGTLVYLSDFEDWWEWDNYNHIASYIGFDEASPSDGLIEYMWTAVNNRGTSSRSGEEANELTSDNHDFDRINIPGWWGNGDNTRFDALYDNLYVAVGEHAKARLVITDRADYEESAFSITVMPNRWEDDRIVFSADVVPGGAAPAYLHVFDSSNRAVVTGLPLCTSCP